MIPPKTAPCDRSESDLALTGHLVDETVRTRRQRDECSLKNDAHNAAIDEAERLAKGQGAKARYLKRSR